MTYQKIEEEFVNKQKVTDKKGLRKFLIKWALFIIGLGLSFAVPAYSLVNSTFALLSIVVCVVLFSQLLSFIQESPKSFKVWNMISNFWWFTYILLIGVYLTMKFFNFM